MKDEKWTCKVCHEPFVIDYDWIGYTCKCGAHFPHVEAPQPKIGTVTNA